MAVILKNLKKEKYEQLFVKQKDEEDEKMLSEQIFVNSK
jgi:hypothetical protein